MDTPPSGSATSSPTDDGDARALDEVRAALKSDFEIVRVLGRGAVATVYLARDRALGVLQAIKVLRPGKAADETARRRFEREARAAASLADHPNTVAVTRFGRLPDETPYLVMQYVKGRTIEERLKAEGPLPVADATGILREVASALALAHEKGIVHRDVRPDNVLWDEEKRRALLTDFGIAAVISTGGPETTRLTKTGQLLGDPRYLSPEQLMDQDVTELTDMYMFGVLGYELLTGAGPYEARSATDWITAHLQKEPRHLGGDAPGVPPQLADMLRRCLAKEPKHRPAAKDVVRALTDPVAEGRGHVATGARESGDLQAIIQKRLPQIVASTAVGAGAVVGVTNMLVEREMLPDVGFPLSLVFWGAAVLASTVIAWFHGEKGRQRAPMVEYVLLAAIAVAWLVVSILVAR